jgi:hypothetical protein
MNQADPFSLGLAIVKIKSSVGAPNYELVGSKLTLIVRDQTEEAFLGWRKDRAR